MGYTHYWEYDPSSAEWQDNWNQLASDAEKLAVRFIDDTLLDLEGPWVGDNKFGMRGPAQFDNKYIFLNATGDEGHETFILWGSPDEYLATYDGHSRYDEYKVEQYQKENKIWEFCKTARKTYDSLVTAILIRASVLMPESLTVDSDGSWQEWQEGRNLYEQVFNEEAPIPRGDLRTEESSV